MGHALRRPRKNSVQVKNPLSLSCPSCRKRRCFKPFRANDFAMPPMPAAFFRICHGCHERVMQVSWSVIDPLRSYSFVHAYFEPVVGQTGRRRYRAWNVPPTGASIWAVNTCAFGSGQLVGLILSCQPVAQVLCSQCVLCSDITDRLSSRFANALLRIELALRSINELAVRSASHSVPSVRKRLRWNSQRKAIGQCSLNTFRLRFATQNMRFFRMMAATMERSPNAQASTVTPIPWRIVETSF